MKHPRIEARSPTDRSGTGAALVKGEWTLAKEQADQPLAKVLAALASISTSLARRAIESGKVQVDGEVSLDARRVTFATDVVKLDPAKPRPHVAKIVDLAKDIVFLDATVVVVRKPSGIITMPFGDENPADAKVTLDALVREVLARRTDRRTKERSRAPLGVVHRLDKETSGLLVFTRTLAAKKHLSNQFRHHTTKRRYLALVHGKFEGQRTFRSTLVENRGDGLRGSARSSRIGGQLAVTHVEAVEALEGATLVVCRLETGRTHQIRIHLSEAGHPLVGESVYIRNYASPRIFAPRTMLHAFELGFVHPLTENLVEFRDDPPPDFAEMQKSLTKRAPR